VTRLALKTVFAAVLIASGLAAIDQATAGTESFRRTCTNIRSYTTTQGRVLSAKCELADQSCGNFLVGQWHLDQRGHLSETAIEKHQRPTSLRMRRSLTNSGPGTRSVTGAWTHDARPARREESV
jgi:hypothetical protein